MKKIIAIACLTLIGSNVFSQKCDFEINGKDDFTGKTRKVTKDKLKMGVFILLEKSGDNHFFRMEFTYRGALDQGIPKNSEIFLKLNDESILKFYTLEDHMPTKQVVSSTTSASVMSYVILNCGVTKEEMTKLSKNAISKLRITLAGTEFTVDVKEGKSENIKNSANCILQ